MAALTATHVTASLTTPGTLLIRLVTALEEAEAPEESLAPTLRPTAMPMCSPQDSCCLPASANATSTPTMTEKVEMAACPTVTWMSTPRATPMSTERAVSAKPNSFGMPTEWPASSTAPATHSQRVSPKEPTTASVLASPDGIIRLWPAKTTALIFSTPRELLTEAEAVSAWLTTCGTQTAMPASLTAPLMCGRLATWSAESVSV